MTALPEKPRAPAVAAKLSEAETQLAEMETNVAALALAESEGVSGAKRDLQALETKIDAARRECHKLRQAHRLALELDRKADAAAAATLREQQFSIFKKHAGARLTSAKTVFDAIATAAPAFAQYAIETNRLMTALPTGTNVGFLAMGHNGWGGSWVGDLGNLIAAEAYRLAVPDNDGRGARLPFAQAPDLSHNDVNQIEPAMDLLSEAQAAALREIELQLEKLNREQLEALEKAA